MENWEIQNQLFLDKTPSFSDVPAFLAVSGSLAWKIRPFLDVFSIQTSMYRVRDFECLTTGGYHHHGYITTIFMGSLGYSH